MPFKHKKKYGQNFLNNEHEILEKIISVASVTKEDEVIEIGPGEGALTKLLLSKARKVTCFEIDKDLESILNNKFKNLNNYKLVMGDVLDISLGDYIENRGKVVANIPYYITSPIINKIIESRDKIDFAFIMVQKEVAERITAKKGKSRSILSLAVEFYGKASYLFTIDRDRFTPVPNVDSAFISIEFYKDKRYEKLIEEELFFKYIKASFSNKRKTILNNLLSLNFSKEEVKSVLKKSNIAENERAENIDIENFIKMINYFEKERII